MFFDTSEFVESLTPREEEVLELLAAEGLRNKKIAKRLGISVHTVQTHLSSIYGKLSLESRAEAANWANSHRMKEPTST